MEQIAVPGGLPQLVQIRQQPSDRAQHRHATEHGGPVRGVGLHQLDLRAFGAQQLGQLPGLVRHAAGWRRQRSDEADPQPGELSRAGHRAAFAHAIAVVAACAVSRSYTAR